MHHCLRAFWGYHLLVDGQTCPVAQDPQRNHTDIGSRPWFPQVVSPICDMAEADTVVMHVSATLDRIHAIDQTNQQFGAVLWVHLTTPIPADIHKKEKVRELLQSFQSQESSYWAKAFICAQNMVDSENFGYAKIFFDETEDGKHYRLHWSFVGSFAEAFELEDFPFDCQDFTVSMHIRYYNKDLRMILLTSDNSCRFSKRALSVIRNAWCKEQMHIWEDEVPKKKIEEPGISRHFLNVTLTMNRIPNYYFTNIIKPTCIITTLSACSLFMPDKDLANRLSATLTLLLTAVAYKYLVAQMVPPIGYSTALDKYVMICFTFLSLMAAENCLAFKFHHISEDEATICGIFFAAFGLYNLSIGLWFLKAGQQPLHSRLSKKFERWNRWSRNIGDNDGEYHKLIRIDDKDTDSEEMTSQCSESSEWGRLFCSVLWRGDFKCFGQHDWCCSSAMPKMCWLFKRRDCTVWLALNFQGNSWRADVRQAWRNHSTIAREETQTFRWLTGRRYWAVIRIIIDSFDPLHPILIRE